MSARVLVTDDDGAIRTVVREALRRAGFTVETAASLAEQRRALASFRPDLLVTDVVLPDGDGLSAAAALRAEHPTLPVIVLSAQNTFATAMRAADGGAFDYLPKPFDLDALLHAARQALVRDPPADAAGQVEALPLIGRSPPMQEVYRTITRVVANDLPVLVLGERGTGKGLVARAIHDFGARKDGPFVAIDLAAMPAELIEQELFGEAGGPAGRIAAADGGTLYLDGLGEAPAAVQSRLLRLLRHGEIVPLGTTRPARVAVRVIAASHEDRPARSAAGTFRDDLYYRLNVVPIRLPALRERPGDVAELAGHFLAQAAGEGLPRKRLAPAATERLAAHGWPGNVRELANMMRRLAALGRDPVISAELVEQQLLPERIEESGAASPAPGDPDLAEALEQHVARHFARYGADLPPDGLYDRLLAELERPLLRLSLAAVRGNQLRAARLLGLNRNTLRKKLTEHGVGPPVRGGGEGSAGEAGGG